MDARRALRINLHPNTASPAPHLSEQLAAREAGLLLHEYFKEQEAANFKSAVGVA